MRHVPVDRSLCFTLLALLAACTTARPISLNEPLNHASSKEYVNALKTWTRHGHIQSEFEAALDVDATLRSIAFRDAYAAKYLEIYRITSQEEAQIRAQLMTDGAEFYEFHLETQTNRYELNDMAGYKSVWQLTLLSNEGRAAHPSDIRGEQVRRQAVVTFYPYATTFSRGWRVRFPQTTPDGLPLVTPTTKSLVLRVAGPQGNVDLTWKLAP